MTKSHIEHLRLNTEYEDKHAKYNKYEIIHAITQ